MPVRIPKPRAIEVGAFAVAGIVGFAPFYMMTPGASQQLESHTNWWAPRWEKNISYFAPPAQAIAQRVEPPTKKTVQMIDDKLPLDKVAQTAHKHIVRAKDVSGIENIGRK